MAGRFRLPLLILCGALVATGLVVLGRGCQGEDETLRDLRVRRAVLLRQVEGLREMADASAHGLAIAADDVAIAIDEALVRDLIAAQLPFQADLGRFHVVLTRVGVEFRGRPLVSLRGSGYLRERPKVAAALEVQGALLEVRVDAAHGTLQAKIAVDDVTIEKAGGLESVLSGPVLRELEHTVRQRLQDLLPAVEIPVEIQQRLELPAITSGPVRVARASMPLQVAVSRVFAGRGRLWVAVHVQAGDPARSGGAAPRALP